MPKYYDYDNDADLPAWRIEQMLQAFSRRLHVYAESEQAEKDYEQYVDALWTQPLVIHDNMDKNTSVQPVVRTGRPTQISLFDDVA